MKVGDQIQWVETNQDGISVTRSGNVVRITADSYQISMADAVTKDDGTFEAAMCMIEKTYIDSRLL